MRAIQETFYKVTDDWLTVAPARPGKKNQKQEKRKAVREAEVDRKIDIAAFFFRNS